MLRQTLGVLVSAVGLSALGHKPVRAQGDTRFCGYTLGGAGISCWAYQECCFAVDTHVAVFTGCANVPPGCAPGQVSLSPCSGPGTCPAGEVCDLLSNNCAKDCPSDQVKCNGTCL